MTSQPPEYLSGIAAMAVENARKLGADAADAVLVRGESTSVSVRGGATEDITRAESCDLGLRVLVGQSQAIVSSSKFEPTELAVLAERAVAMAKLAPADAHIGLADADQLCSDAPDLDLADDVVPSANELIEMANTCDRSGLAVEGVSASVGSSASASRRTIVLAASNGFSGAYQRTGYGLSAAMISGEGTGMERDYDYQSCVHFEDLRPAEEIGCTAGERVAKRLNARKAASQTGPVVYEQRVAGSLVNHLSNAVNGAAVARGTSFLKDCMDEQVFRTGIAIVDDARRLRGHGSRPFDGEGLATGCLEVVSDGALKSWLLDLYSTRKLGLEPTGNASRGTSSVPTPAASNLNLMPGTATPEELIADIEQGFFVTELIGMGVNGTTGDYSRGAAGYWIENGEITYPVSEVTIAGNLKDMFKNLTPADDLILRGSINAPTCRIDGMTIAGV